MATLRVPTPLRPYAGGQSEVKIQGGTVGAALTELTGQYGALQPHLFSPDGQLRQYINLFLNDEDIRDLQGLETPLKESDRLMLVPSIAGG
jgi:molybdopterin converting factor small subunit